MTAEKITQIMNVAEARGIKVEVKEIVKNSVNMWGMVVKEEGVGSPVYYISKEEEDDEPEVLVDALVAFHERNKSKISKDYDDVLPIISSKKKVLERVRVCLQRNSNEDIIKRWSIIEGAESYIRIFLKNDRAGTSTIKVDQGILDSLGITEEEAWEAAIENTIKNVAVESIMGLTLITNKEKAFGASGIICEDALREAAQIVGSETIAIVPSSVHEILVVPVDEERAEKDIEHFNKMVKDVNATTVDPKDQLADSVTVFRFGEA